MVSYFVSYRGEASDRDAFLQYYAGHHAKVLAGFPGIRGLTLHTAIPSADPFPVQPGGRLLLAQMTFDTPAALDAALASEARARAREDFANFPRFDGQVSHQAMAATRVF